MIKTLAYAAALATTVLAFPVNAGTLRLGTLDCTIDGGVGYVITSNKGVSCTFRPYHHGPAEQYTGMISKLGIDVGQTHQGQLAWAVLAATRSHDEGDLAGSYYGVNAEASVVTGGGANLLVGGLGGAFMLEPLSVQAQTGVNLAVAVTSLELIHSFK
ncbi:MULTISPECIES: DUF992 domain-containing protein [Mesorhizobium]|uniref:DUF992 domain-containing protein n=1 Tax=Mesorhizobium abyssinicae TaxID=1209958 RepID=A0ABU5AGU4_9HYPH|nr:MULTISPECIES: DUF992 domain-containing protein [Mesorhizobium]MDX8432793.1 DUF992 domain-containing protein [Mesorhizobium abyssinicae]MDX8536495.1 DUF992 domain-containing protein [Mesorhizobium abyssinicae]RUW23902.1 DUF992 domain-containing protein [Mesorhizobium sp. M4B.F.Ca.ET.013.02.1.1]RUW78096.1 DUF992 domain-containing protein [Mesorhizobium sp. M4B.F.Ca.ET.049.02.1.2]RVD14484.1 DUF992 domain-containing protein [Mesorhizobium sp. M4B.F.Ca.ET.017.02.2.1]